jgi:hypothetical protein
MLFDPDRHHPAVPPEDAVLVVRDFLLRARAWATEREIPKRLARVADGSDHVEAGKLASWVAWRDFIDHTVRELEDGTLDAWFSDPSRGEPPATDDVRR